MKLLLFIFLFLSLSLSEMTWASAHYKISKVEDYPFMDLYEVEQVLYKEGFVPLDQKRLGFLTADFTDQIFLNPHQIHNQFAAVKLDISYSSKNKILALSDNEFVCHAQTSRHRNFALYLNGLSKHQINKICNQFSEAQAQYAKNEWLKRLFLPNVGAGELCLSQTPMASAVQNLSKALSESQVVSQIGTCLLTALRGATGTVTGLAESLKNSFNSLLLNPRELWNEVKNQILAVKDFVVHIKDELSSLKQALSDLDPELILQLGCQVSGEIIAGMGIGALTGAGIAKLSARLLQIAMNLKKSKTMLTRLNELVRGGQSEMAKKVLSCATQ